MKYGIMNQSKVMITALVLASNFMGCAKSSSDGTLTVGLQMGSYTTSKLNPLWKLLGVQEANAAVTSLKMCFKRLRFKAADVDTTSPSTDAGNMDFAVGEVNISNSGALLGSIKLSPGNYRRIEFDLDSSCASGKSVQLVNAQGSFSTNQSMTIKFSGNFTASADGVLTLGVQNILTALNSFNAPSDLKVTAEGVSGNLAN